LSSWFTNGDSYGYRDTHSNCNSHRHGYSDVYAYGHGNVHAYGHSNIYFYSNSDCYGGHPYSDANMHTRRDLVRHFERFWYSGG
jgi:hypothetical protein